MLEIKSWHLTSGPKRYSRWTNRLNILSKTELPKNENQTSIDDPQNANLEVVIHIPDPKIKEH